MPDCHFYLIDLFLKVHIPYLYFFLLIKEAGLKGNVRQSVRVHNPRSSQIVSHLNGAPIKIQCLSLLVDPVVTGGMNADLSGFSIIITVT